MSHIKTYCRIKPATEPYSDFEISGLKTLNIRVPELLRDYGFVTSKNRSSTISYDFQFDGVFDYSGTQEDIYNATAKEIVNGFLDGYNGTIFAYGQTGTGKTYTVEGSARQYRERGLAPRALTDIYKLLAQRESDEISVHISYLEIYQEVAFDLLSATARSASPVLVFPKVNVIEGPNGTCMIRNLSIHLAPSEDVAHALLLQGQANRKVAETPVNQRSSRSHAVFTVYLTVKKPDSDVITRSKLHMVDLAGSERVAKTGVDGKQLTEAKSINLSLHYLESVIIALQADARLRLGVNASRSLNATSSQSSWAEGIRRHVPYRNSVLTMVLRDSLGGNCLTSMIATVSLEVVSLGESLSTCRFAQRVACIANHARRNEEIDDKTLIQQLRRHIAELEAKVACLRMSQEGTRGEHNDDEDSSSKLTDEDKLMCAQVMQDYLAGRVLDPMVEGITSPSKFCECLRIMKKMVMSKYFQPTSASEKPRVNGLSVVRSAPLGRVTSERVDVTSSGEDLWIKGRAESDTSSHAVQQAEIIPFSESSGVPEQRNAASEQELCMDNIQQLYASTFTGRKTQHRDKSSAVVVTSTPLRAGGRQEYKSPFERKREKEIKKLSQKVSTLKQEQISQEEQLDRLRTSTAVEELSSLENIIRKKIQVTRDQIADQHAYRLHLRHTEADQDVLEREKLVEGQLIKRETKFQRKLEEVLQKKAELEAQSREKQEAGSEVTEEEGCSLAKAVGRQDVEDQFPQFKKRNGTLNTRQVFDMLRSEEKKATKASHNVETEKMYLMSKQLALKEEATRQKLRELKEMLRRSREESAAQGTNYPPYDGQANGQHGNSFVNHQGFHLAYPSSTWDMGDKQAMVLHANKNGLGMLNSTYPVERQNPEENHLLHQRKDVLGSSFGPGDNRVKDYIPDGYDKHLLQYGHRQRHDQEHRSISPSRDSNQANAKHLHSDSAGNSETLQRGDLRLHPYFAAAHNSHRLPSENQGKQLWAEQPGRLEDSEGRNGRGGVVTRHSAASDAAKTVVFSASGLGSRSNASTDDQTQQESSNLLEKASDRKNTPENKVNKESQSPVVMPSEYVRSMDKTDKFDARRMGLSAQTFDNALSSMLNDQTAEVGYRSTFYDQYARSSRPPNNDGGPHRSTRQSQALRRGREQIRTNLAPSVGSDDSGTAWGPEAKNHSVAERLAQFLNSSDNKNKGMATQQPEISYAHKMAKEDTILDLLTDMEHDIPPRAVEFDVKSPRIQALQDTQREPTYMSRVLAERDRVSKIRQARDAAETIQRAWRRYCRNK